MNARTLVRPIGYLLVGFGVLFLTGHMLFRVFQGGGHLPSEEVLVLAKRVAQQEMENHCLHDPVVIEVERFNQPTEKADWYDIHLHLKYEKDPSVKIMVQVGRPSYDFFFDQYQRFSVYPPSHTYMSQLCRRSG